MTGNQELLSTAFKALIFTSPQLSTRGFILAYDPCARGDPHDCWIDNTWEGVFGNVKLWERNSGRALVGTSTFIRQVWKQEFTAFAADSSLKHAWHL